MSDPDALHMNGAHLKPAEAREFITELSGLVAFPVLDFEAIGQGGDGFTPGDFRGPARYNLEKYPIHAYFRDGDVTYPEVRWTKGFGNTHGTPPIPTELKNLHREFWGFKPLRNPETA